MKRRSLFLFAAIVFSVLLSLSAFAYVPEQSIDIDEEFFYEDDGYYYDEYGDVTEYQKNFDIGKNLLIAFIVGLVIALIITGIMRSKMKSVRFERAAQNYIRLNSMNVLRSHDMYLYSHISKRPKPQNNNKR